VLILSLDTSSPAGSIAILRDENIVGEISTSTQEAYSTRIFRHLDFLLRELSLNLDSFDLFAVAAGPGSFTGLRVGLTAAKAWAEAYGKPVAAVSALEAIAAQSRSSARLLVPVLDAKRGEVYFGFYKRSVDANSAELALDGAECSASPDEFFNTLNARADIAEAAIVTSTPEVLAAGAASRGEKSAPRIERVSSVLAPEIGRIGLRHARSGKLFDALTLDAHYVRRSDAEVQWKGIPGS
jgi:tRNA threonylcarbamoyladenosine biosynthesis protein TsaB